MAIIRTASYVATTDGGNRISCNYDESEGVITIEVTGTHLSAAMAQIAVMGVAETIDRTYPRADINSSGGKPEGDTRKLHAMLNQSISDLRFSARLERCLLSVGMKYLGDIVGYSEQEILKIRDLGRVTERELIEFLLPNGLSYGMETFGWVSPEKH